MKKYFYFLIFSLIFINSVLASRYDSTLVSYNRIGDGDCQTFEYDERKIMIVTDINSIILIQDSLYFTLDSSFNNVKKFISTLDSNGIINSECIQYWDSTYWLNYSMTINIDSSRTIYQLWSVSDSAWVNNFKSFTIINGDTTKEVIQDWDISSQNWIDRSNLVSITDSGNNYFKNYYLEFQNGQIQIGWQKILWKDNYGNILSEINSSWSSLLSSFVYDTKDSSAFYPNNLKYFHERLSWVGNYWANIEKEVTYYNSNWKDTLFEYFVGDSINWFLDNLVRNKYYNSGLLMQSTFQKVDSIGNLLNDRQESYQYSISNKETEKHTEIWSSGVWVNNFMLRSYFDNVDSLTMILSLIWSGTNWDSLEKKTYGYISYFPVEYSGNYSYYNGTDNWDYYESYHLSYDTLGRLILDWRKYPGGLSGRESIYKYFTDNTFSYTHSYVCTMGGLGSLNECLYYKGISITSKKEYDYCIGSLLTPNISVNNGTPPYKYSWTPSYGISDSTILNPTFNPDTNITYYLFITDSLGNVSNNEIKVIVNTPIQTNIGPDTIICTNTNFQLNAGSGFSSYLWQDGQSNQQYNLISNTPDSILFSVTVVDSNDCPSYDTALVVINICNGINIYEIDKYVYLFPNLITQERILKIRNEKNIYLTLLLYDNIGKETLIQASNSTVSLGEGLSDGLYFYRLLFKNELLETGKLVLQ